MKDEKKLYVVIAVLLLCLIVSLVFNFTHTTKLKNGEEVAVKFTGGKITADDLYGELKDKYASSVLVNMLDHKLLDKEYKTDETEKSEIDSQVSSLKSSYETEDEFLQVIQTYYGVSDEEEFRDLLSLQYKREKAVNDYIEDNMISDNEINEYYESKIIGDVKASHILIKVDADEDDSEDEKTKKEEEALEKAKEIIKKLDNGEDFSKLAKKYSDDEGTAEDGGDLGYFNTDDNYEEEFVLAAASLDIGKYTEEPIKTEYGYEIILKVAEKDKPKLKDVKSDIKEKIREEKLNSDSTLFYNALSSYRESKKVTFKDSKLKSIYKDYLERVLNNASSSN